MTTGTVTSASAPIARTIELADHEYYQFGPGDRRPQTFYLTLVRVVR